MRAGRALSASLAQNRRLVFAGGSLPRLPRRRSTAAIAQGALVGFIAGATLAGWFASAPAAAQNFGRNNVAWTRFQWQVLHTQHFDVTFYPQEEAAARLQAAAAERWHERLAARFGVTPKKRTPLVLYADQSDFQKTVTAPERIDQATGGLIEPQYRRVILPLTGDAAENERRLGHEIVHVFEDELIRLQSHRQPVKALLTLLSVPRFMNEGLAEYLSRGRDSATTAMWLRDGLLRGELPDLGAVERLPRPAMYRWGQAFWAYVGGRWGDDVALRLYVRTTRVGTTAALREVLQTTPRRLSDDWHAAIREAYGPFLAERTGAGAPGAGAPGAGAPGAGSGGGGEGSGRQARLTGGRVGERLIPPQARPAEQDVAPALSPDGRQVAYLSTRGVFGFDLLLADARSGAPLARLLSTGTAAYFDALRFLDSAATWSPDGTRLAVVVFTHGADHIALLDVARQRVEREVGLSGVGAIADPAWSPDGRSIAFVGSKAGEAGLYLLDVASLQFRKLTGGEGADAQPAWSPDGRTLAFSSDRWNAGTDGETAARRPKRIWLWEVEGGGRPQPAVPLTADGGANQIDPHFAPDGRQLYYVADRGGVSDVYRFDLDGHRLFQVTHAATGVSGIASLSPALDVAARDGRLMFSVFADGGYALHALDAAMARGDEVVPLAPLPPAEGGTRGAQARSVSLLPPWTSATGVGTGAAGSSGKVASSGNVDSSGNGNIDSTSTQVASGGAANGTAASAGAIGSTGSTSTASAASAASAASTASAAPQAGGANTAWPVAPYRPGLALESLSPGLGLSYSSLGYAVGGDISALLGDTVDRYQVRASLQGTLSRFQDYGGEVVFLDQGNRLHWGIDIGQVPAVSGFSRVTELPAQASEPPRLAIDQIYELINQDKVSLFVQYPFSPTERLQASVSYNALRFAAKDVQEVLVGDRVGQVNRFDLPTPSELDLYQESLALVGDTSEFGYTSPVRGQRYRFELAATGGNLHFEQITADFRQYFRLRPFTLAVRGLHLGRYGTDADSDRLVPLYIGDGTLVRGYDIGSISASECTPSTGTANGCPEFNRLVGSRLAVANVELRLPLFGRDNFGLYELRWLPTELAVFFDAGSAWNAHDAPHLRFTTFSTERIPVASTGVAARVLVAGLAVIQVYVAKPFQRPERGSVVGFVVAPGW